MIDSIHLIRLRNAEYLQLMTEVIALTEKHNPETLLIQTPLETLKMKQQELGGLFKKQLSSSLTAEIEALDSQRDNALQGIVSILKGYAYHYDETLKEAAKVLQERIQHYGKRIVMQSYQAETATLDNLISDWEKEAVLTQALTSLNLTAWKDYLKEKNTLFAQKYLDRTQEYGQANPENIKQKREETNEAYYHFKKLIEAHAVINPDNLYKALFNDLNALILQYNHLLKQRESDSTTEESYRQ